jgi:hypothetical protein
MSVGTTTWLFRCDGAQPVTLLDLDLALRPDLR